MAALSVAVNVLAFDVGTTTGFAYVVGGELWRYGVLDLVKVEMIGLGRVELVVNGRDPRPELVVIERPFLRDVRVRETYARVSFLLEMVFKARGAEVHLVRSSDWKHRMKRWPLDGLTRTLRTPHERDAYKLAVWAAEKYKEDEDG